MSKVTPRYRIDVVPLTALFGRRDPRFSYASTGPIISGSLASISFGKRSITGVTLDCTPMPGPVPAWMKTIGPIIHTAWLSADQILLAQELSERHYAPLNIVFRLFFPLLHVPRSRQSALGTHTPETKKLPRSTPKQRSKKSVPTETVAVANDAQLFDSLVDFGKQALRKKKLLCILIPEVLAAELYTSKLKNTLPNARIDCLTSRRTDRDEYFIHQAIRERSLDIIIGTRQLIFAPFDELSAIIVIDAEKKLSYTQWEMTPRYDAVRAAESIAQHKHVPFMKLSVAPGISFFAADITEKRQGTPFSFSRHQTLTAIDLRKTFTRQRTIPVLTPQLMDAIRQANAVHTPVLLLVKQRGLSRFSLCAKCSSPQRCSKCETVLSEMTDGRFRCLACNFRSTMFPACPHCGHMHFRSFGAGTQAIERALKREGLVHSLIVVDRDTTQTKHDFTSITDTLRGPTYPSVIIATYEAAYSLPLPPLGLIALIEPDLGLSFFPDYQTEERLWLELRRFGAKLQDGGHLYVQTFNPESVYWTTWVTQKLETTAANMLEERRALHYPPYFEFIQLECFPDKGVSSLLVAEQAEKHIRSTALPSTIEILPKYLPFNRKNRYHILIRYPRGLALPDSLSRCLSTLNPTVHITSNPFSLLG